MTLSMAASSVLLIWIILAGIFMWRLAPRLEGEAKDGAFNREVFCGQNDELPAHNHEFASRVPIPARKSTDSDVVRSVSFPA